MMLALVLALSQSLTLRTAKLDITPPEPLPLGGYTARAHKPFVLGAERLYARVLVLEQPGGPHLAIASCEMLTIPQSLYDSVRKKLPKDCSLFLTATHTHSAPDSQMLNDRMTFAIPGITSFKKQWLDWYSERIALAVQMALKAPPAGVKELELAQFKLEMNRGRREGAKPDQTASVLEADGKPILVSYAAHAVFYGPENMHPSGDWPGALAEKLGCPVLMGAIGDVSPHSEAATPEARIQEFVARFTAGLAGTPKPRVVWHRGDAITARVTPIPLDPVKPHPTMAAAYHAPEAFAKFIVGQFAPREAYVTVFDLGKLSLCGIPGEPTSHLGNAILDGTKGRDVIVTSHVNGWIGYILDPVDYDKGGYESTLSFYGREEGEKVAKAAIGSLISSK